MKSLNRLYVQSLDQPLPSQDTDNPKLFIKKINHLASQIKRADAIVIGIGSGLSSASGYDFYHPGKWFSERFSKYQKAHSFETLFDGLYHVFNSNEEQWAFNAEVAHYIREIPTGLPYKQLASVIRNKNYFVLTTNIDGQASRVFDEDKLFLFQGDLRYCQCSQPCCESVVDNTLLSKKITETTVIDENGVPKTVYESLPRCAECGRIMTSWIRDINFLEGEYWHNQEQRYIKFLKKHLVDREDRVLFLELGVSSMTPAIIKMPFWSMCEKNPQTEYVCINMSEASAPAHLGDRASVITADLGMVTTRLLEVMN